jgi:hypothetical protein
MLTTSPANSNKLMLFLTLLLTAAAFAADAPWTEIPASQWPGNVKVEVPALKRVAGVVVAFPAKEIVPFTVASAQPQAAGLYEVRVTARPSHVNGAVAFNSGLRVKGGPSTTECPGQFFARVHQAETRVAQIINPTAGPLRLRLEAFADPAVVKAAQVDAQMKKGGPNIDNADPLDEGEVEVVEGPEAGFSPGWSVYYVVDKLEFRPLSRSGQVTKVEVDKLRYSPGSTLKGSVVVTDVGGKGGDGTVNLYLEHNVRDRTKVSSLPVKLAPEPQRVSFTVPLPKEELGYALVAEFVSPDGADRSIDAEYFNIATNFNRVAMFGGGAGSTRDVTLDDDAIRRAVAASRAEYYNACEYFAWAEDDMVEMSPDGDYWFSGQTNYHMNKGTIQRQIRIAQENGIAMVTYGKYCMSGYPGWKMTYDYPNDNKGQYMYPVGMWGEVNTVAIDRFRNHEVVPYSSRPHIQGNVFDVWWSEFLGVTPDATPRMVRIAAEEVVRSVETFGWDGVRWDGHPRGGGPCGGENGKYDSAAARKTQTLLRYFKDIVGAKFPNFGHGYNYYFIQQKPNVDWAYEDFELDELARGGGLLMNESIGNASGGWTFESIVRNLQVEGDLSRERGGYFLGISFAKSPRDIVIESALWAAGGARPYNSAFSRAARRYCTRYSQYTFDERLRRLDTPEKVLTPQADTRLWWQPFVYETPLANGKRQLVVNLLNIPKQAKRPPRDEQVKPEWEMPAGTDPVAFTLTLPAGIRASGANLIDPQTLEVAPLTLQGTRLDVPAVASWSVVVIDLAVEPTAPSLASLYGPPKTFGVPRPGVQTERKPEMTLDPTREVWEVNKDMSALAPAWSVTAAAEQAAVNALSWDERNARVLTYRDRHTPESLSKEWWRGGSLPDDQKLKAQPFTFGDLAPRRNGRVDIFHGRGTMDYRLRMPLVFAGLDKFAVHDAPLWGVLRQGPGMGLANNVPWSRYPDYDLLLFTGIPHCAIGAENSYGLVEYVKAGGAAFFTGGEYAFGKGGYLHTVLERDLLPVLCVEMTDTRYSETPLMLEPGKDFADLKVKADFAAKPSFWVWNQVALKPDPGIKVFLKSGNRPILVGWQVGKGRVACLLVDHRGLSERGTTAYFDWTDWPTLARAVFAWLAPEAGTVAPPSARPDLSAQLKTLAADTDTDVSIREDKNTDEPDAEDEGGPDNVGLILDDKSLKKRTGLVTQLLRGEGSEIALALAEQAIKVGNLPDGIRTQMLDFTGRHRPAKGLEVIATSALASTNPSARSVALQVLGIAGGPAFFKAVKNPPNAEVTNPFDRDRSLAFGVAYCTTPDLVEEGRRRVAAWNAQEKAIFDKWTRGKGFSLAAPAHPGLDAEALFQRVAWLAYLRRHDPTTYGAQFAREWLMTAQYQDYCERSTQNLWSRGMTPDQIKRAKSKGEEWARLRASFGRLRTLTKPDIEAMLKTQSDLVAAGFKHAHFTLEVRAAMNLLGDLDRTATAGLLEALKSAENADLAEFAAARLAAGKK